MPLPPAGIIPRPSLVTKEDRVSAAALGRLEAKAASPGLTVYMEQQTATDV